MSDPQTAMAVILKPPKNFEEIYQGVSRTIPIPFVAENDGEFTGLDELAGLAGVDPLLERFVPVPIGSSVLIVIPRPLLGDGTDLRAPSYTYDLRWRLRTVTDYSLQAQKGVTGHPYSLITRFGAPSTPAPIVREVLPAYTSEALTPATTGNLNRPIVAAGISATVSQGLYDPADFSGLTPAAEPGDAALGITCYPPYLKATLGNELSIVAYQGSGTWDFTSKTEDGPFSNLYGTNLAGTKHPAYPGVGIILIPMWRNTTP